MVCAAGAQVPPATRLSGPLQQKLAPGLADYTDNVLFGQVWPGPGLSPRDRSLVVISVLIATNKPAQLQGHLGRALTNGVTPLEASGVLTHLAFYAGWPSAVSALDVYDKVYTTRKVDFAALQAAVPALTAAAADVAGARSIATQLGAIAPRFAQLSNDVVLGDLWRRSDLQVRDRSLVTIVALAAMGDAELIAPYVQRGLEAGLTRAEISEALTHLAFYAGWGKSTSALAAVSDFKALDVNADSVTTLARPVEEKMRIWRKNAPPVSEGPASNFTGKVQVMAPYLGSGGSRLRGATVKFQRGARTAWHQHPMGQALIVTEGCGWTQREGGPVEKICAGDVAWIAPGEKHWHGATRASAMTHVTASESVEGENVQWFEQVSDEEYARGPR
jgi:4-carboxymuconolactone decarboxylase